MKAFLQSDGNHFDFHWNIDASVGKGGANTNRTDVEYLQWYYSLAAQHPRTPPERRHIYAKVQVTGTCIGVDADPLVQAIFAHQRALSHPIVDGRISVANSSGKIGDKAFFIIRLGARLADMYPQQWPRLDLIPRCPGSVADAVRLAIPSLPTG